MRRATSFSTSIVSVTAFLSTLSLRRATGKVKVVEPGLAFLSTLSLRRATLHYFNLSRFWNGFYPRSPCGERHDGLIASANFCKFLSTLSLRRATLNINRPTITIMFLSTLSLRRATEQSSSYSAYLEVSIHALLAESDKPTARRQDKDNMFLSTLSLRRATNINSSVNTADQVSIHALLAESDTRF